ncbi:DMT family transporter [Nocardioides aequoreus]|uniref:DMT family transporter n=1 Tax=Nocardioides aequoreus TaxID=397278 RepID=UPI000AC660E6|nr:multidrug efflux SMR transporter [Nocardioides aequoreus]
MLPFVLLLLAIAAEVFATALLPRTAGFTHLGWSLTVLAGYAVAIWLLALVVQRIPVSVAYAVWAGLGTATVAVIGITLLGEPVSAVKVLALTLIVVGVVLLNLQGAH